MRFWGPIGINRGLKTMSPGVVKQDIEEVYISGNMNLSRVSWPNAGLRDGVRANHVLSVVTPEDSDVDFTEVVYICWQGRKWSVAAIEFKRPRVDLHLGGLYNG